MRDSDIINMKQASDEKLVNLYRQMQFLNTRIRAYELIFDNRWALVKTFLFPSWLKGAVDSMHGLLIKEHDDVMRVAAKKAEEERNRPKLIVPALVMLFALMLPSCVTMHTYKKDLATAQVAGYNNADKECLKLQGQLGMYITQLQERLKLFNQIDEQGKLIPLKKDQKK